MTNRNSHLRFATLISTLVLISVLLNGCVTTEAFVTKDTLTLDRSNKQVSVGGVFAKPEGKGPFPAVVILQSCGGHSSALSSWASKFNEWGYASFIVRSLESRGHSTCPIPYPFDRMNRAVAGDAYGALEYLQQKPEISRNKIAVIGFSMGGLAINWVILSDKQRPKNDFAATISFYAKCPIGEMEGLKKVPNLQVAGSLDKNHYAMCDGMQYSGFGANYQFVGLVGAHHAFDDPSASGKIDGSGNVMRYSPEGTKSATEAVKKFLSEQFAK